MSYNFSEWPQAEAKLESFRQLSSCAFVPRLVFRRISFDPREETPMRMFLALIAAASLVSAAVAAEPQAAKTADAAKASAAAPQVGTPQAKVAADSNYRHFNGQWWYWWPQTKSWKVWNGNSWVNYQPGQATQIRTQALDGSAAVPTYSNTYAPSYRQYYGGFPDSVSNTRILNSYGFRSAGSKIEGRY
jgi:hypothetical protein